MNPKRERGATQSQRVRAVQILQEGIAGNPFN